VNPPPVNPKFSIKFLESLHPWFFVADASAKYFYSVGRLDGGTELVLVLKGEETVVSFI
jgi:hypothetical protein